MGVQHDEMRLRQIFDAMTADQPEAPPGRYSGVKRRAVRRRWNLAAGSLVLVAAAAASAIGIGLAPGSPPAASGSRPVPGWALPWPDHRNGTVPQRVLDQAVLAWRHQVALYGTSWSGTAPMRVIWYLGRTIDHGQVVAIVFEADTQTGHRLVAGWATATEVMNGQPGWSQSSSPWIIYDVPAPSPHQPNLAIGLNIHGSSAVADQNPDNWVVELTVPTIETIVFWESHAGSAGAASVKGGRGLFVIDAGRLNQRVQILRMGIGHHDVAIRPAFVGVPGSLASETPQLERPAPLVGVILGEIDGQGNSGIGWKNAAPVGLVVVARCYGQAPLRVTINNQRHPGVLTCDGAQHEFRLHGRQRVSFLVVTTSGLTSYRVGIGRN